MGVFKSVVFYANTIYTFLFTQASSLSFLLQRRVPNWYGILLRFVLLCGARDTASFLHPSGFSACSAEFCVMLQRNHIIFL